MTRAVNAVVSSRLATLAELDTVYGTADLYLLYEVLIVESVNKRLAMMAGDK